MLSIFAASELHTTIKPEVLFEIAGVPITNSMLFGWITGAIIVVLLIAAQRRLRIGGARSWAELVEVGTEFVLGLVQSSLGGSRSKAIKYAPIFVTMFFFILLHNWFGLIPGVGSAIQYDGQPLFRAFTADLNSTFAMALFGMVVVQVIAIIESGPKKHAKHYFPGSVFSPLTYLIGIFEIFTEFTRLLSLGLRLFLNVAIGEVLIAVAAYLGGSFAAPIAALPFTLLEIFVGVLQAFIFVVLCTAYLSATMSHGEHPEEEHAK